MAYQLATAFVKIGTSGLSGLGAAFTSVKNIVFGAIGGIGSLIAKFGSLAGGIGLGFAVKLAADAEEMNSKFEAVFQDGTADAKEFATTMATDLGRSVNDVMGTMAGFQDLFVPLGFAREEGKELSKTLTKLTEDVASFQDKSGAEVSKKFTSALVGNYESVRDLGIVIDEATLKQELMNMGVKGGIKAATNQQKVQARLNLLIAGSGDAMGDAQKTAGSFTNRMKGLTGAIKDIGADIGSAFLPALANIAKSLTDLIRRIQPFVQKWAQFFADMGQVATTKWQLTWEIIKNVVAVGLSQLKDRLMQYPEIYAFVWGRIIRLAIDWGVKLGTVIKDTLKAIWGYIRKGWDQIFENMRAMLTGEDPVDLFLGSDEDWASALKAKMGKVGNAFGEGFSGGSISDVLKPSQGTLDKMDALKKSVGEFKGEMDDLAAARESDKNKKGSDGKPVTVKTLTVSSMKLPTGFIDFASANKTIQEALLKGVDPAKEQVKEQQKGNQIAAQIKHGIDVIGSKIGSVGGSGAAVAST